MKDYILLLPILFPAVAALFTLVIGKKFSDRGFRQVYVGITLALTLVFTLLAVSSEGRSLLVLNLTSNLPIYLKVDKMTMLFDTLVSVMWLLAGVYSFEYMKHEDNNESFYLFYLLTEAVLVALGMAGNFMTLYLFYEFMTLLSLPLALHSRTKEAISGGLKYLFYSIFGASLALLGFFFMNYYGNINFVAGGTLDMTKVAGNEGLLYIIFFLTIIGFSIKAGMFPFHGWLPSAHPVAPAPASAVLSGVITKAGVLAIIRVIYYQVGVDFIKGTWVQYAFMTLTLITVFMGSMMAFKENVLKKRLAYSSVSQVSYVLFGLSTMTVIGFTGALLQVVFHSITKNLLFMAAGSIIYKTHKTKVDELKGIGKSMPITMWCFTIGGLALVGIPPMTGFVSKWFLAQGSLASGVPYLNYVGPIILLTSALLTAGYLFTISISAFIPGADFDYGTVEKKDPNLYMIIPLVLLAVLCVVCGTFSTPLIDFFGRIATSIIPA